MSGPCFFCVALKTPNRITAELSGFYTLSVENKLSVSHVLTDCPPCDTLHGHTWRVRAEWVFSGLDQGGMGVNFRLLKNVLREVIVDKYDHRHLNEISPFDRIPPTAENFAREIFTALKNGFDPGPKGRLARVELWEGPDAFAAYQE